MHGSVDSCFITGSVTFRFCLQALFVSRFSRCGLYTIVTCPPFIYSQIWHAHAQTNDESMQPENVKYKPWQLNWTFINCHIISVGNSFTYCTSYDTNDLHTHRDNVHYTIMWLKVCIISTAACWLVNPVYHCKISRPTINLERWHSINLLNKMACLLLLLWN